MNFAAPGFEEGKLDLPVLLAEEADSAVLLLYTLLCYLTIDDVCAGSTIASVGGLLHSSSYVLHEYPALAKILPIPYPVSPFREHNVSDEIPSHDLWSISAEQFPRVGGDQEVWSSI